MDALLVLVWVYSSLPRIGIESLLYRESFGLTCLKCPTYAQYLGVNLLMSFCQDSPVDQPQIFATDTTNLGNVIRQLRGE